MIIHKRRIGVFQVKHRYNDPAKPHIIHHSATVLSVLAYSLPNMLFTCNYPGIGAGGLERADVERYLAIVDLPDNVEFWI